MNTTTIDPEVRDYLAAVKERLADLPADELDDLTIDLESHLAEVHAEGGATLVDRLGSPAAYAAELRTSAGFSPRRLPPSARLERAGDWLHDLATRPTARRARDAWEAFRPVWVAIRGWLLIVLGMVVVVGGDGVIFSVFPIPQFGTTLGGLLVVALATASSYAAAGRAATSRRWRWVDAGLTGVVAVLLLGALGGGAQLSSSTFGAVSVAEQDFVDPGPLATVTNIYAYDFDGKQRALVGRPVARGPTSLSVS